LAIRLGNMIDMKAIQWSLNQEADYATCVKNVLYIIRTNYASLKKLEIHTLLNEFMLCKFQNDGNSVWNQVSQACSQPKANLDPNL
jgi:hypothetical protein